MTARLLIGDVRDRLAELPDSSVDLVVTSPPFLALRSYLPSDHPDKHREIGSEPTPAAFLDTLLALTDEFRRVLTPYGSIAVELGDTYAGSGGAGGDYNADGLRAGQPKFKQRTDGGMYGHHTGWNHTPANDKHNVDVRPVKGSAGWPLDKCLTGIPSLYANSLAYGWNMADPWNGRRYDRWRVRNLLTWCRPNPPVGALGDKFRPATSFVTVATMGRDRWFDLDAVRTAFQHPKANERNGARGGPTYGLKGPNLDRGDLGAGNFHSEHAGAPPLDWDAPDDWDQLFADALDDFLAAWWQPLVDLPTQPYAGAHYATFPIELPRRLIEAMCPRQVCTTCGEPRRRVVEVDPNYRAQLDAYKERQAPYSNGSNRTNPERLARGMKTAGIGEPSNGQNTKYSATTLGWTDCGHNTWRNGIVLDPFSGSGTTLAAATGCGRDAIGIDLDDRNVALAEQRVGMFLEVEGAA